MILFSDTEKDEKGFALAENGLVARLFIASEDYWGVKRAVEEDLRDDIEAVTNLTPELIRDRTALFGDVVFVGTIGKSPLIDHLISVGKLKAGRINGKWESFLIQVIDNPLDRVKKGLFIVGSDKRGTIFGVYELCRQMGVSPWHWWADVPVKKQSNIYIKKGLYTQGEPSVKYRGIFLNDEAPSLSTWVEKRYGGFNHHFYQKVYQLLLRLKANFLWPAMWKPRVFNEEDPLNPFLADKYGIVMGTSHHEPMMRSWEEWGRAKKGEWNYNSNAANIYQFWEEGLRRVRNYEGIITVGMRGDGDEPMIQDGTFEDNKELLERIIRDQRKIIARVIDKDVSSIPQLLALYKEVQSFYENGLEIPEDITLLLSDDNFGNIRMLPTKEERERKGGYGMYYHLDYVGAPRSYQWINTVPLQKIWDQLQLTYHHGVDRLWILNVGDLKPMELPISFFLELARDINKWDYKSIGKYTLDWAKEQFGSRYAGDITDILQKYTRYNGRRKPELIEEDTFSLINYREAERVLAEFDEIVEKAEKIFQKIAEDKRDAFFQLVLYPARASRNILKLHVYAGKNKLYAEQGRITTNDYAELAKKVFEEEAADTSYYNKVMSAGKWDGMMLQPHIGRAGWRGPEKNTMPPVKWIEAAEGSEMGVYLEGQEKDLDSAGVSAALPEFSPFNDNNYYLEIFNKGTVPFEFKITPEKPWIRVSKRSGIIEKEKRIIVSIDWKQAPAGRNISSKITVSGTGKKHQVPVNIFNPAEPDIDKLDKGTFVESNQYISIEAEHYTSKVDRNGVGWEKVSDYGRTLSSMLLLPTTAKCQLSLSGSVKLTEAELARLKRESSCLEYKIYLFTPGEIEITVYTAPTLNFNRNQGLRYAIALDQQIPQIADLFPADCDASYHHPRWSKAVTENVHKSLTAHLVKTAGYHSLKIMMVDPGVAVQKIVLDMGGVKPSYLGPPESYLKP